MQPEGNRLSDTKNFERFFMEYHDRLVLYALKFVNHRELARDLVQEAFAKLWESRQEVVITVSIKAYIFKVVHNLCMNHLEQQKIRTQHHAAIYDELKEMESHFFNGETSLLQQELGDSIEQSVNALPPDYREVIELSRYQGLKNKVIAAHLKLPLRTIETRIYRALKQLRIELTKRLEE